MNVKQTPDPEHSELSDLDVELDEVPDASQQGSAIVGGGADSAKAYVAPIAIPARVESKPPPPAAGEGRVKIEDRRVDPRRMPTIKISARELAAGKIPGFRPGALPAPAASEPGPKPDWATPPAPSWAAGAGAAPHPPQASSAGRVSGALWIFALVLTLCAVVALGAALWVQLSRGNGKPTALPASSAPPPLPSSLSGPFVPEAAPAKPSASAASTRPASRNTTVTPKPTKPARR